MVGQSSVRASLVRTYALAWLSAMWWIKLANGPAAFAVGGVELGVAESADGGLNIAGKQAQD